MALKPKPVSITTASTTTNPPLKPQPLVIVQGSTAGSVGVVTKQAAITNVTTADATDATTAAALANADKAKINAILAALRSAGVIVP